MAVLAEEGRGTTLVELAPAADPAPLGLAAFVVLAEATKLGGTLRPADVNNGLAWFVLSFAIFNTYMMLWALRVNVAVFGVFLTLEITEILLTIGLLLQGCPRDVPLGPPRRWLGRDRDRWGRLVRLGCRGHQRDVAQAGASGRTAALGEGAGCLAAGCADGERASGLGCTR